MSAPDTSTTDIIEQLNQLARELFDLLRRQAKLKEEFTEESSRRKQVFELRNADLEDAISTTKRQLRELVDTHRQRLIKSGKKSFATVVATYYYRMTQSKFRLTDKSAAEALARKLGVLRKVSSVKVVFTVDPDKLAKWLSANPEHKQAFAPFVKEPSSGESLSLKPNETYLVQHGTDRISNDAITLTGS